MRIFKKELIDIIQESVIDVIREKNTETPENSEKENTLAYQLADLVLFGQDTSSLDERRGGNIFVINTDDSAKIGFLKPGLTTKQFREMTDDQKAKVIREFIEDANKAIAERYYFGKTRLKRPPSRVLAFMGTDDSAFRPFKAALNQLEKDKARFETNLYKAEQDENPEKVEKIKAKLKEIEEGIDKTAKAIKDKINVITDSSQIDAMAKVIANPEGFSASDIEAVMGDDGPQQANKLLQILDQAKIIQFKGAKPGKKGPRDKGDSRPNSDEPDGFNSDMYENNFSRPKIRPQSNPQLENMDKQKVKEFLKKEIIEIMEESKSPNKMKEIEEAGKKAALEAKLAKVDELLNSTNERLTRIDEDDEFGDMMDRKKVKEIRREVKILEKMRAKLEKEYGKVKGKQVENEPVIDEYADNGESSDIDEMFDQEAVNPIFSADGSTLQERFLKLANLNKLNG